MNTRDVPAAGFSKCIITVGWCVHGFCAPAASEADQQKLASANAGFAFRLLN